MIEKLETPECDKMFRVHEQSQAIGEFIEWMSFKKDAYFTTYGPVKDSRPCSARQCIDGSYCGDPDEPCETCEGTGYIEFEFDGYMPLRGSITEWLAEFFDIDLTKVEEEKRLILNELRGQGT